MDYETFEAVQQLLTIAGMVACVGLTYGILTGSNDKLNRRLSDNYKEIFGKYPPEEMTLDDISERLKFYYDHKNK